MMKSGYRKMALAALMVALLVMCGAVVLASEPVTKPVKATSIRLNCTSKTLYYTTLLDDPLNAKRELQIKPRILPAKATANTDAGLIEYKSSNPAVATVDEAGRVLAVKGGSAVVTAKLLDGSKRYARIKITVKALPAQTITLVESSGKIEPKMTVQLSPVVGPETIKNKNVGYSSSNKKVATVSSAGVVKAVAPGTAKITVYAKSKTSVKTTYKVTVDYKYRVYAISNGAYKKKANINLRLDNAKPDMAAIKRVFAAARFDGGAVKLNSKSDLTAAGIRSYLKAMKNNKSIEPDDVTIFYYSGHGVEYDAGTGYNGALVGVDVIPGNVKTSALVTISEVTGYLSQIPGQVIVILDSCYSGEFIQAKGTNASIVRQARARLINQGIVDAFKAASAGTQSGVVTAKSLTPSANAQFHVITGSANDQESYTGWGQHIVPWGDSTERSLLTYFIEEGTSGAKGAALRADTNGDGAVSLSELYVYAKPRVQELLERLEPRYTLYQDVQMWPQNDEFAVFAMN